MINFGLPYLGSKSKIAADLICLLPPGKRFVEPFAGGCAMTHAALLAGKWDGYILNDIAPIPQLFVDAVTGKYHDEKRWISRDDFKRLRDTDLYVRVSWSFGNKGDSYLYAAKIEPYKRACHYAVVFDDWEPLRQLCPEVAGAARLALKGKTDLKARRLAFGPAIVRELKRRWDPALLDKNPLYASCHRKPRGDKNGALDSMETLPSLESLESLESLQSLESLERLQSLESLESLERLQSLESRFRVFRGDYRLLGFEAGDVVYCDPPYKGTAEYNQSGFDHDAFYDWACSLQVPVYISEYNMPEDRFMCVWRQRVSSRMQNTGSGHAEERLYVPRKRK